MIIVQSFHMTESIFEFLNNIGFTHPVHPALTHIPMGMVMGAVIFRLVSFIPKLRFLAKTGYHCVVLGLIGVFPTAFAGYLDWQAAGRSPMDDFGGHCSYKYIHWAC